jgi:hypothetical protein
MSGRLSGVLLQGPVEPAIIARKHLYKPRSKGNVRGTIKAEEMKRAWFLLRKGRISAQLYGEQLPDYITHFQKLADESFSVCIQRHCVRLHAQYIPRLKLEESGQPTPAPRTHAGEDFKEPHSTSFAERRRGRF